MILNLDDQAVAWYRNSRAAYHRGDLDSAHEFYRRNRAENGCELYFECDLPEMLRLIHPIGCVLGRAEYRGALVAYQNSGVGGDLDGNKPVIGDGVCLFPGARILGNAVIGDNVFVQAGTIIQNQNIPNNTVVYPTLITRGSSSGPRSRIGAGWYSTTRSVKKQFFGAP